MDDTTPRQPSRAYADIIRQALAGAGHPTDDATVVLVEEVMRTEQATLDHLTVAEMTTRALQGYQDALELHEMKFLAVYCHSFALTVPTWAVEQADGGAA